MTKLATAEAIFVGPARLEGSWLNERRKNAIEKIRAEGVPNRRAEAWKYSDLKAALEAANDIEVGRIAWALSPLPRDCDLFDLENAAEAPEWVRASLGKSAAEAAIPAASLAFAQSGFAVRIGKNVRVDEPVRMHFQGSGHSRVLVVLEEGASVTLVETPSPSSFSNIGFEAVVGRNARLTLTRVAEPAPGAIQVEDVAVRLARDATFHAHLLNGGASFARLNLRLTLKEPGATAELSGASVLGGELHADVSTHVYHASGETHSEQLFKHAVAGRARAVYQGKITVAEGANGSDSRQTSKAILLSPRAEADLKPELEILADDVKCAHGAAIGDLDADSLFYLRARGVDEREARNLLIHAFLEDAVQVIAGEGVRNEAQAWLETLIGRVMVEDR